MKRTHGWIFELKKHHWQYKGPRTFYCGYAGDSVVAEMYDTEGDSTTDMTKATVNFARSITRKIKDSDEVIRKVSLDENYRPVSIIGRG